MFDISTGQSQQVAQHDAPIKVVKWIESPQGGILATGSWDKTIKVRITSHFPSLVAIIILPFAGHSIGTYVRQTRWQASRCQNDAIPWM